MLAAATGFVTQVKYPRKPTVHGHEGGRDGYTVYIYSVYLYCAVSKRTFAELAAQRAIIKNRC